MRELTCWEVEQVSGGIIFGRIAGSIGFCVSVPTVALGVLCALPTLGLSLIASAVGVVGVALSAVTFCCLPC